MTLRATIPADLLYWGYLPPGGPVDGEAQRYRFERVLPVPVESLHLASTRLPDGGTLLIGIEPERLRARLAGDAASAWEVLPDGLPTHLAALPASSVLRLDLRHGAFEAPARRRVRRRVAIALQVLLGAGACLVIAGVERRVANDDQRVVSVRAQARQAVAQILPAVGSGTQSSQSPTQRLTMELRRLELAVRDPAAVDSDLAPVLEALWQRWPTDVRIQTEAIAASAERVAVRGRVAGLAEAERLATACATITAGGVRYRAEPIQVQQDPRGASFLLTLMRQTGGAAP